MLCIESSLAWLPDRQAWHPAQLGRSGARARRQERPVATRTTRRARRPEPNASGIEVSERRERSCSQSRKLHRQGSYHARKTHLRCSCGSCSPGEVENATLTRTRFSVVVNSDVPVRHEAARRSDPLGNAGWTRTNVDQLAPLESPEARARPAQTGFAR